MRNTANYICFIQTKLNSYRYGVRSPRQLFAGNKSCETAAVTFCWPMYCFSHPGYDSFVSYKNDLHTTNVLEKVLFTFEQVFAGVTPCMTDCRSERCVAICLNKIGKKNIQTNILFGKF